MFGLFKSKNKIDANENNPNNEGGWVFVSHSNKDWHKVKIIRDYLENKGLRLKEKNFKNKLTYK